jgi:hypothetical protein
LQLKIFFLFSEELLELISVRVTTTDEVFYKVERLLQRYELPVNEFLCLMTDGAPAFSDCKSGVVGKLNAKVGHMISNFQCIVHQ